MSAFRDDERTVIQKVRQAMPFDCVIALFKSETQARLFKANPQWPERLPGLRFHQQPLHPDPSSCLPCAVKQGLQGGSSDRVFTVPHHHQGQTPCAAPQVRGEVWPHVAGGPRFPQSVQVHSAPGKPRAAGLPRRELQKHGSRLFTFTSKLSVPLMDGGRFSSYHVERTTGHKLQVTTAALLAKMKRRSMEALLSLRDTLKDDSRAIVVVFQSDPLDAFVMEHIRCVFRDYPIVILGGQAVREVSPSTAADATATPPGCDGVTVMVLKLMPVDSALKKVNTAKNS